MFAPVDPAIEEKVISDLAGNGKGRNQITRELHEQGIKVSHGSVSNIINAHKRMQPSQPQVSPESDASTGVDMNSMSSPSSTAPRDGGPLSHLLNEDSNSDPIVAEPRWCGGGTCYVAVCQETWENIGDIDILLTKLEPFRSEDLETEMS